MTVQELFVTLGHADPTREVCVVNKDRVARPVCGVDIGQVRDGHALTPKEIASTDDGAVLKIMLFV